MIILGAFSLNKDSTRFLYFRDVMMMPHVMSMLQVSIESREATQCQAEWKCEGFPMASIGFLTYKNERFQYYIVYTTMIIYDFTRFHLM